MKKLISVVMALALVLSMSVFAFAFDESSITLDADHIGLSTAGSADVLTIVDGSITANEVPLFSLILPEKVPLGDTVVVHIKGTSECDFRVWLLAEGHTDEKGDEITFSNQWKGTEHGFNGNGEFEKYIELTAEDYDQQNCTVADRIAFKGASFGVNLTNFTINYVGIIYNVTMEDIEGDAVSEAQTFADDAASALESAKTAADEAALTEALNKAQAAVDALTEKASLGFPSVTAMLDDANAAVKEINGLIEAAAGDKALADIQSDIDALDNAVAAAKNAGKDIDAINAALSDAKAAAAKIDEAAAANDYATIKDAAKEAKTKISEIETALKEAEDAKKAEEEAAKKAEEEAAAAKKKQTTTIIIVVAVVVVIAIIAAIVVGASKKKKK